MRLFARSSSTLPPPTPQDLALRYTTSYLLPPLPLALLRILLSLYAFTTTFFTYAWDCTHADCLKATRSFSYFTDLCYWGLAFYFLVAGWHGVVYWGRGRSALEGWMEGGKLGKVLGGMHGVFYSSVVVFPFLVSDEFALSTWENISQHAMNSGYALFEIFVPRTLPMPWWHLGPLVVILAMYLGLAYVTFATQGFYTYSFLDDRPHGRGRVAAYVIGILVGTIIVFAIVHFVIKFRVWLTEEKLGMTGKLKTRRPGTRPVSSREYAQRDIEMGGIEQKHVLLHQTDSH